jgi:hypothetical protein
VSFVHGILFAVIVFTVFAVSPYCANPLVAINLLGISWMGHPATFGGVKKCTTFQWFLLTHNSLSFPNPVP